MDLTVKNFMENSIGHERLKGFMNLHSIDLVEMLQIVALHTSVVLLTRWP